MFIQRTRLRIVSGPLILVILTCFGGKIHAQEKREGLVGEWLFDENVKDTSGMGNDGHLSYQAAWYKEENRTVVRFDGKNSCVTVLTKNGFNPAEGTMEFWAKCNSFGGCFWTIGYSGCGNSKNTYGCWIDGKTVEFVIHGLEKHTYLTTPITDEWLGKWHHIVCVWKEPGIMVLYIDGVMKAASARAEIPRKFPEEPGALYIGSGVNDTYAIDGYIDEFRAWNRALTEEEIKAIYSKKNEDIKT